MRRLRAALAASAVSEQGRRWVYAPYDQLSDAFGPLASWDPRTTGLVLVESSWKAGLRPYHQQKLAYVLANQRQFAIEQARRGVAVRYVFDERPYDAIVATLAGELGPLTVMEPAERELRVMLAPLVAAGAIVPVAHAGWLTDRAQFVEACGAPPWRMDAFYRRVRRDSGILMAGGKPVGGRYSFDRENRRRWDGEPEAPAPPTFVADEITEEVVGLVERRYGGHPGRVDAARLPSTAGDAARLWAWAKAECLPWFGPFEDAMSTRSRTVFHTLVSPLLNLHRLTPRQVVGDVLASEVPLACREGFVRQVIGWREFVRHVHRETDGFRAVPGVAVAARPGDAGWGAWSGWRAASGGVDGGACPDALGADGLLPAALWGAPSGMACLDGVVAGVMADGWSHHITRLMVISNLGTLLGWSPRALTDWFWAAYVDAYDWVVEPNVLGMGTYALGELMTTKPYVSGAAYIERMSDYCDGCALAGDCPVTRLYWAFLARNGERLRGNRRMALPLASARKRAAGEQARDRAVWQAVRDALAAGARVMPGVGDG
ncbi:MAG: cryptochrome/photolyase family protein [Myxococcales bacterium]|nr:cryptochrome/photolyase family protein [Myxococcales bacterium]